MGKLIEVENLKLSFPMNVHKRASLRDVFVQTLQNPIRSLTSVSQRLEILSGINLTISRGERIALIGVNGTGKTSLCRTMAGVYQPSSGKIQRYGRVRGIFESVIGIYPDLTGRENAHILSELLYPEMQNRSKKVEEALVFSELGAFLDTPFKHYSNGMQTRLCLSILTMEPTDILILDEVFEGADQFFREKIAARVIQMIEESGAVLFVSHDEEQLRRVCKRAIWLNQGRIEYDGEIEEGLRRYSELGKK